MDEKIKVEITNKGWSGWWIVLAFFLGLFLSPHKVEAKEIRIGLIEYGVTAANVCNAIEDGDLISLRTQGGSVEEAHALADCVRSKDVVVKVLRAYSAGAYVAFSAKKVCLVESSTVGTHTPYSEWPDGSMHQLTMKQVRGILAHWGKRLYQQGYSADDTFFLLGLTFMTDSGSMTTINRGKLISLLGTRYVGHCDSVKLKGQE